MLAPKRPLKTAVRTTTTRQRGFRGAPAILFDGRLDEPDGVVPEAVEQVPPHMVQSVGVGGLGLA